MLDYNKPFESFYKKQQNNLYKKLIENSISKEIAQETIESGYYMYDTKNVYDSYYSPTLTFQGSFPFNSFVNYLKKKKDKLIIAKNTPITYVNNLKEITQILESDERSKYYLDNGWLTFRGQKKEYFTTRKIPNPAFCDKNGKERLIIPSIYRKYYKDFQKRIVDENPYSIFETFMADDLIYYGIKDRDTLFKRNFEKYGNHSISELGDFPEPENQEYYKRWSQLKVQGRYFPDIAIISQHYGFQTNGLDLTFNIDVAAFFATHGFYIKENGKADYMPIDDNEAVIYCFYFRVPQIRSSRDLINNIEAFDFIKPVRPIRQNCALPFFLSDKFNEANQFLFHIFKLNKNFNRKNLPKKEFLFPSTKEDKFYKAALEVKEKNDIWKDFIEYDFE